MRAQWRYVAFALGFWPLLSAAPAIQRAEAGVITLTGQMADPESFTSTWTWTRTAGTWATGPVTETLGELVGQRFIPYWRVTLQGFAAVGGGGDLRDTSQHLVGPHIGDDQPGPASFFDYLGASAGVGPIVTMFPHPGIGHIDVYRMTTAMAGPNLVNIDFTGRHTTAPAGSRRTEVPEPGSLALLVAGLIGLGLGYRRRR